MNTEGLDIDVFENALEFNFNGRDLSDKIVQAFVKIASILQEASGEIRCEIDDDEFPDPAFKFYTISNSLLWEQTGKIVRGEKEVRGKKEGGRK